MNMLSAARILPRVTRQHRAPRLTTLAHVLRHHPRRSNMVHSNNNDNNNSTCGATTAGRGLGLDKKKNLYKEAKGRGGGGGVGARVPLLHHLARRVVTARALFEDDDDDYDDAEHASEGALEEEREDGDDADEAVYRGGVGAARWVIVKNAMNSHVEREVHSSSSTTTTASTTATDSTHDNNTTPRSSTRASTNTTTTTTNLREAEEIVTDPRDVHTGKVQGKGYTSEVEKNRVNNCVDQVEDAELPEQMNEKDVEKATHEGQQPRQQQTPQQQQQQKREQEHQEEQDPVQSQQPQKLQYQQEEKEPPDHQRQRAHQERLHRHISLESHGELASCHRNLALEMVRVTESAVSPPPSPPLQCHPVPPPPPPSGKTTMDASTIREFMDGCQAKELRDIRFR